MAGGPTQSSIRNQEYSVMGTMTVTTTNTYRTTNRAASTVRGTKSFKTRNKDKAAQS